MSKETWFDLLKTPAGTLEICATERGIVGVTRASARRQNAAPRPNSHTDQARRELQEYFDKTRRTFSVTIDRSSLAGATPFRELVWRELERVPYGEVTTYGALAARIGKPGAARAVGGALNKNPILIIVPCHRVVATTPNAGGFALGMPMKVLLLEHEKAALAL